MTVAPLLVALALYAYASGAWPLAIGVALGTLATRVTRRRLALAPAAQRITLAVAAAAGIVLGLLREPDPGYGRGTLPAAAAAVAMAAMLMAMARSWMRAPERGYPLTFAIGLVGVAACGATRLGAPYAVAAIAFFALSLAALRADDPARAAWSEQSPRARLTGALVVVAALGMGAAIAHELPLLYDFTQARFDATYEFIGFRGELRLGSLDDLKKSDEIVLRIAGPRTDYLRGGVYDHFDPGSSSWALVRNDMRQVALAGPRPGPGTTELRRVGGWGERYFVPLRAGSIGSSAGEALVDPMGVMRPAAGKRYDRYWFDANARDDLGAAEPTPEDLRVPERLRPSLEKILVTWTLPGDDGKAVLAKIARHFDDEYAYSLAFERPAKDPILDFLFTNKQGNCEYFASAAVLLARAAKIPARVAAGYRVAERNPLTGRYVVRQKNAHSWIEAWLPGEGWTTVDPTPASKVEENLARDEPMIRALVDVVATAWAAVSEWWGRLTVVELGVAAASLTALFAIVRFLRRRGGGSARRATPNAVADDRPLPCLARLLDALAARGVAHAASEPIERLAARLDANAHREPAELLARYVAFRYGGVGDEATLAQAMDGCAERLQGGISSTENWSVPASPR